ncbi:MAG: hypothetical protein JXR23_07715 [Pontiellaceae bacterium]|nr:hypothetical protein [Pontiellaceae bacterium]
MKRLVVFFPSWRYFGHFALPLFEPLTDQYEVLFFHTEKAIYGWDDFPDLTDKGIAAVDLKSFRTYSFVTALRKLNPDCLVVLDKGWVQDRAILHAARYLGIPSIQIQHGSVAIIDSVTTNSFFKRTVVEFFKIIRTLRLYNTTVIRVGIGPWLKSLPFQFQLLRNPNNYYRNHRNEITADAVCITGACDRPFFIRKEGYRENQLVEMGNKNYEKAYALRDKIPSGSVRNRVLLVSQPLFEEHILPGGMKEKLKLLQELVDAVMRIDGVTLAVKPHPREDEEWFRSNFPRERLHVYDSETDVNDAIVENRYVIGFFSTALINAIIMRKPLGIIRWVDDSVFGLELDKDGAAISLNRGEDIARLIALESNEFDPNYYAYNRNVLNVLTDTVKRIEKRG